ncbi:hypothetical protein [Trueperella pyogenes]
MINEQSLAESFVPEDEASLGDPGAFDMAAFVNGVRSRRRVVRIYGRGDLEAKADMIRADMHDALMQGNQNLVSELTHRLKKVQAEIQDAALNVVLEERSHEWQARKLEEIKAAGVTSEVDQQFHLVASQIVDPVEVDGQMLAEFAKVIPGEVTRIMKAWADLSGHSESVLLPF